MTDNKHIQTRECVARFFKPFKTITQPIDTIDLSSAIVDDKGEILNVDVALKHFGEDFIKSYRTYWLNRNTLLNHSKGKWVHFNKQGKALVFNRMPSDLAPCFHVGYEIAE